MVLDKGVVSATSCKDLSALRVKQTLKEKAISIELVVEAAQRADIDLALYVESLDICVHCVEMSK